MAFPPMLLLVVTTISIGYRTSSPKPRHTPATRPERRHHARLLASFLGADVVAILSDGAAAATAAAVPAPCPGGHHPLVEPGRDPRRCGFWPRALGGARPSSARRREHGVDAAETSVSRCCAASSAGAAGRSKPGCRRPTRPSGRCEMTLDSPRLPEIARVEIALGASPGHSSLLPSAPLCSPLQPLTLEASPFIGAEQLHRQRSAARQDVRLLHVALMRHGERDGSGTDHSAYGFLRRYVATLGIGGGWDWGIELGVGGEASQGRTLPRVLLLGAGLR